MAALQAQSAGLDDLEELTTFYAALDSRRCRKLAGPEQHRQRLGNNCSTARMHQRLQDERSRVLEVRRTGKLKGIAWFRWHEKSVVLELLASSPKNLRVEETLLSEVERVTRVWGFTALRTWVFADAENPPRGFKASGNKRIDPDLQVRELELVHAL